MTDLAGKLIRNEKKKEYENTQLRDRDSIAVKDEGSVNKANANEISTTLGLSY
jgi:hypothetical protein